MVKASFILPDGTLVNIEGVTDEIKEVLDYYSGKTINRPTIISPPKVTKQKDVSGKGFVQNETNLVDIINKIKSCDESELIESQIFDKSSRLERILLPMYIVKKYFNDDWLLSSGDISKIYSDLGIHLVIQSVSNVLSDSAKHYVMGDKVRTSGVPTKYKIGRKGMKYLEKVIFGDKND